MLNVSVNINGFVLSIKNILFFNEQSLKSFLGEVEVKRVLSDH